MLNDNDDIKRYKVKIMNVYIAEGNNTYTECKKDSQNKTILVDLYVPKKDFIRFAGENGDTLDIISGQEFADTEDRIKNKKIGIIKNEDNKYSFIFNEYEFYLPSNWDGSKCVLVPKGKFSLPEGTQTMEEKKDEYQIDKVEDINIKPNNVKKINDATTQTENDYQINKVNNININSHHRRIKSNNIFRDKKINTKHNDEKQFKKRHKFYFKSIYDYESDNEKVNKILAKFTLNNNNKKKGPKK